MSQHITPVHLLVPESLPGIVSCRPPHRAVVMAGGKGTRLAPYSSILPKPLIPVADRPILELLLIGLARCEVRRVTLCVGHLAELIVAYFGTGERYGLEISYAHELEPTGTVGALRSLADFDEDILVVNADVLTDIDFAALLTAHADGDAPLTIACRRSHVDMSVGVVEFDAAHTLTRFREKPRIPMWTCMGIYAMSPRVLEFIPEAGMVGIDQLSNALLAEGFAPAVFPFEGVWFDLAGTQDCEDANLFLRGEGAHLLAPRDPPAS